MQLDKFDLLYPLFPLFQFAALTIPTHSSRNACSFKSLAWQVKLVFISLAGQRGSWRQALPAGPERCLEVRQQNVSTQAFKQPVL